MTLLGLLTTKHFLSFILGCPQDFNFAWPFWYGWVETGLNGQNRQAKLKSCGHPGIKKNVLWSGNLKASLRIATKKNRFIKRHLLDIYLPFNKIFSKLHRKDIFDEVLKIYYWKEASLYIYQRYIQTKISDGIRFNWRSIVQ